MKRAMVYLRHRPDSYSVEVNIYNEEGRLVESLAFDELKQIIIEGCEVRINRQLSRDPLAMVITANELKISHKEGSLLYIKGM